MKGAQFLTRAAIIAALYAVLTIALAPISYGQIQCRVSEGLTALPYLEPAAIPGLFIGCMIANIYGGYGFWDIFGGSALTLAAAFCTWLAGRSFRKTSSPLLYYIVGPLIGLLPPLFFNAFGVAFILMIVADLPYWLSVAYVGAGEGIAVFVIGYPLLVFLLKRNIFAPVLGK